jgi:NAD(P)-dependent dehydrogenase (short-subunit alcohol dehydrogenase family)
MWDGILSRDYHGEFRDRKVIVAGGAAGIGAALAGGLHWLGAQLVILDKNEEQANALADRLQKTGGGHRPLVVAADLTDETARKQAVDKICKGSLPRALVSTLGLDRRGDLASLGQAEIELLLRINFIAPVMLARDLIMPIRKGGGGAICLFSSHHGSDICDVDMMGYGAAKAALDNGIRRLAKFAGSGNDGKNNVRVFGLRPGWVMTENQAARFDRAAFDAAAHRQILPTPMVADDVVPFVISSLCERNAKLLSGAIVDYDAGGALERDLS